MNLKRSIKPILLILAALILPSLAAAQSFSDSFEDGTFNAWSSVGPGWAIFDGSWDGSKFADSSSLISYLFKNFTVTQNYWEFSYNSTTANSGIVFFRSGSVPLSDACRVTITSTTITTSGAGSCAALGNINYASVSGRWYTVKVTDQGTTLNFKIYNTTTSTLLSESNLADASGTGTIFALSSPQIGGATSLKYDDIVVGAVSPTTTNSINWGASSYVNGDLGSYSWTVSTADWDDTCGLYLIPFQFRAEIFKNSVLDKSVALPGQTGTNYYGFETEGHFEVKLQKYCDAYYYLGFDPVTIASDSVSVHTPGDSYIFVATKFLAVGRSNNITVGYGFTPSTIDRGLKIYYFSPALNQYVLEKYCEQYVLNNCGWSATSGLTASGTYYANTPVQNEGQYKLVLYDFNKGDVATLFIQSKLTSAPPITNISRSFLIVNNTDLMYGDAIVAHYGVDNTNLTYGNIYMAFNNTDRATTSSSVLLAKQTDYLAKVLAPSDSTCTTDIGCFSNPAEVYVLPGNNSAELRVKNGTNDVLLANASFTVSATDSSGFGLSLSKYSVCKGDSVIATVYAPNSSSLQVFAIISSGAQMLYNNYSIPAGANGRTYVLTFNTATTYEVRLHSDNEDKYINQVHVTDCFAAGGGGGGGGGGTPAPTAPKTGSAAAADSQSNLIYFMSMPAFWGVIILIISLLYLAEKKVVDGKAFGYVTFVLVNLFAVLGLFDPFKWYVLLITWIAAAIFFVAFGRNTTSGQQGG